MRVLIFGTVYVDTPERQRLVGQWDELHHRLNPQCDLLLIDSNSLQNPPVHARLFSFPDNIGHLSRGGRDGWGRAFCYGIEFAMDQAYDYAVHIEADSLCKLDVMAQCETMRQQDIRVMGVPVHGTKFAEVEWIETGLLFMNVQFMKDVHFIEHYAWEKASAKRYPTTPEWWLFVIFGTHFRTMDIRHIRDDRGILTVNNVRDYDWITHTTPQICQAFIHA